MVITRSPFVKKQTIDYGYSTDPDGNVIYTDVNGKTEIIRPSTTSKDSDKKVELTNRKLDGTLAKTVRTIKSSNLSENDKVNALRDAMALRDRGAGPQFTHGGIYNNTVGLAKESLKGFGNTMVEGYMNLTQPTMRAIQSGVTEGIDFVRAFDILSASKCKAWLYHISEHDTHPTALQNKELARHLNSILSP